MRASALPAVPETELGTPQDHDTPTSNFEEMAIDPGLMEGQQFYAENNGKIQEIYSRDGPQGDPFAPQPALFFPPPELDPPKIVKRKRRQKKCEFCGGNDLINKDGQPEDMFNCVDCDGKSGHPSCMPPLKYANYQAFNWKCAACKSCEICGRKDNDQDLLLCDGCDRGWHRSCLDPPMPASETPAGDWFCSECSILELESALVPTTYEQPENTFPRAESVASSSKSAKIVPAPPKKRGRPPKVKVAITEDQTVVTATTTPIRRSKTKTQTPIHSLKKGKLDQSDDELVILSARQPKRVRYQMQSPVHPSPAIPKVRLRISQKGKGKGKEREEEDLKGLFDDVLGEVERDTLKTVILPSDKHRFEKSRAVAEQKIVTRPTRFSEASEDEPIAGPSTRPLRSNTQGHLPSNSPAPSTPDGPIQNQTTSGVPPQLRIRSIRFGAYEIKTWYDAPFPEEYANIPDGRLWICEFCLKYMKSKFGAVRHQMKCKAKHPPGDEIYRDGVVSIFEVDGRKNKIYCQNLCLLSKMYLDHKSLFYDVEPFLFYVMTEVDDVGARFVGYFSKEKRSPKDYNVSCIMTLPVRQRQGWGNLLIDFSYLLSKKEQRTGSPEKPLSALGELGYKNYWTLSIMRYLETAPEDQRLEDISAATSMTIEDIYNTLTQLNMISYRPATPPPVRPSPGQSIKYIKGRRGGSVARRSLARTLTNGSQQSLEDISKQSALNPESSMDKQHAHKGPFIPPKEYSIAWDPDVVMSYLSNWEAKGYLKLRAEKLKWSPFLVVRGGASGTETVGVVKKTEAKGAVGIAMGEDGEKNKLLSVEDASEESTNQLSRRETETPLSLFDDDNVVNAAEMKALDLSSTMPLGRRSVEPEAEAVAKLEAEKPLLSSQTRSSGLAPGPGSRTGTPLSSRRPALSLDVQSPSPRGRKGLGKPSNPNANPTAAASRSASKEAVVNGSGHSMSNFEDAQVRLNDTGIIDTAATDRDDDADGDADDDLEVQAQLHAEDPDGPTNSPVPSQAHSPDMDAKLSATKKRGRPPKVKQAKLRKLEANETVMNGIVTQDDDPELITNTPTRTLRSSSAGLRLRSSRSSQKSVTASTSPSPFPEFAQRQLRNRAVAVARTSGDTGVSLGMPVDTQRELGFKRTGSVNGNGRPASLRKRRRIDSSPERDVNGDATSELPALVRGRASSVPVDDDGTDDSEEATAATSLLSLLHSKPVVFASGVETSPSSARVDLPLNVKEEDTDTGYGPGRHSIPSDVTVFGNDMHMGEMIAKGDEHIQQVDAVHTDVENEPLGDEDLDAEGSTDDNYDIDDGGD